MKQSESPNYAKLQGSLIHRVFHEPLGIMYDAVPELLVSLAEDRPEASIAERFGSASSEEQGAFQVTSDRFGNPLPKMTIDDGIAFIPLRGTVVKNAGNLGKWYGMADLVDFTLNLRAAEQDPKVRAIVLAIDSPGGFTTGVHEAASMVSRISKKVKPIMAFTESMMGSAAYWVGSGSMVIYGTSSSILGSIGTYLAIMDASKFFERMGVKIHVFRSGEHKGAGIDGISPSQASFLQERVNKNGQTFKDFVSAHRPLIDKADMNGQAYSGYEASPRGFAGGVVGDLEEAVARFRNHIGM